jgi:uncharacterized protein YdhG (YjbR/CyaY superfamily)
MWQCPTCGRDFKKEGQNHSCEKVASVDAYIAGQPAERQPLLRQVRETIRQAAPEAAEKIAWNMPTYWQGENLIHFAAFAKHLSIYPGDLSLSPFLDRLTPYRTTKGAIHFPYDKPTDLALIEEITRYRASAVAAKKKAPHAAAHRPAI